MLIIKATPTQNNTALSLEIDNLGSFQVGLWEIHPEHPIAPPPTCTSCTLLPSGKAVLVDFEDGASGLFEIGRLYAPTSPELLIYNIGQLLTMEGDGVGLREGYALVVGQGKILAVGPQEEILAQPLAGVKLLDARGGVVSPGLCDAHTHPVFAGDRAREFALRLRGATYEEILAAGGGIHNSTERTRAASFEELLALSRERVLRSLSFGVTSMEGKSGYALNEEGELKSLRVLRALDATTPVTLSSSLLAAHVVPKEFSQNRQGYVSLIIDTLLPTAKREGLVDACDVFCETSAFTLEETRAILTKAKQLGIHTRIHAGQFNSLGAVSLGAQLNALSVDHLEVVSDQELDALAKSDTVATLLPGAALTLGMHAPSARTFLDRGIPVALATDMNPGTSMTENLPLMASLGTMQMGMNVDEVWRGITLHGAKAAGLPGKGRIAPGLDADLVVWDLPDYAALPYHFGVNLAREVIVAGVVLSL